MSHETVGCGAMPVPLPGWRVDGVAGPDLDQVSTAGLDPAHALGDMDRLAHGMGMPRVAGPRREADGADAHPRGLRAADDHIDPGVADEPVAIRRAGSRRTPRVPAAPRTHR